ncbi:unnamed protein product [Polarella glacialis]|uniref:Uncharacterized protein n=1 Tax=Polarella glacialis TaxID=89957 RepID=A0A813LLH4_POLGL|nr:unnamed protein product [Polarella glacialis]
MQPAALGPRGSIYSRLLPHPAVLPTTGRQQLQPSADSFRDAKRPRLQSAPLAPFEQLVAGLNEASHGEEELMAPAEEPPGVEEEYEAWGGWSSTGTLEFAEPVEPLDFGQGFEELAGPLEPLGPAELVEPEQGQLEPGPEWSHQELQEWAEQQAQQAQQAVQMQQIQAMTAQQISSWPKARPSAAVQWAQPVPYRRLLPRPPQRPPSLALFRPELLQNAGSNLVPRIIAPRTHWQVLGQGSGIQGPDQGCGGARPKSAFAFSLPAAFAQQPPPESYQEPDIVAQSLSALRPVPKGKGRPSLAGWAQQKGAFPQQNFVTPPQGLVEDTKPTESFPQRLEPYDVEKGMVMLFDVDRRGFVDNVFPSLDEFWMCDAATGATIFKFGPDGKEESVRTFRAADISFTGEWSKFAELEKDVEVPAEMLEKLLSIDNWEQELEELTNVPIQIEKPASQGLPGRVVIGPGLPPGVKKAVATVSERLQAISEELGGEGDAAEAAAAALPVTAETQVETGGYSRPQDNNAQQSWQAHGRAQSWYSGGQSSWSQDDWKEVDRQSWQQDLQTYLRGAVKSLWEQSWQREGDGQSWQQEGDGLSWQQESKPLEQEESIVADDGRLGSLSELLGAVVPEAAARPAWTEPSWFRGLPQAAPAQDGTKAQEDLPVVEAQEDKQVKGKGKGKLPEAVAEPHGQEVLTETPAAELPEPSAGAGGVVTPPAALSQAQIQTPPAAFKDSEPRASREAGAAAGTFPLDAMLPACFRLFVLFVFF